MLVEPVACQYNSANPIVNVGLLLNRSRLRRASLTGRVGGLLLTLPALLVILLLFAYPLARLIFNSFAEPTWSTANYRTILTDATMWRIILNTVVIAAESTFVALLLGYPVAFVAASLPPAGARLLLALVLFPFWTSILARLYAWQIMLSNSGVVNSGLHRLGVDEPVDLLYNRISVIVGMVHYLLPFMIFALFSSMSSIDTSLSDASLTLGASRRQTFAHIYLPLSAPGIFTGSLLVFILALGFYLTPAVLGGPQDTTIAVFIQQRVTQLEFGQATAMATVLLLLVGVLFFIYDRYFGFERLLPSRRGAA